MLTSYSMFSISNCLIEDSVLLVLQAFACGESVFD